MTRPGNHRTGTTVRAVCLGMAAAFLAVAAPLAAAQSPAKVFEFPRFAGAKAIDSQCQALLAEQKRREQQLAEQLPASSAQLLAALDDMNVVYEDTLGPLSLLASVHPDKAVRDAADACDLAYQGFNSAFLQNESIYKGLKAARGADAIDARLLQQQLEAFEDSGVGLDADKRARARTLNTEMTRLSQEFERRVREDKTQVAFTAQELDGVPAQVWKAAKRDAQGRVLLGLDYPSSVPVIEQARSAATRERMWRAVYAQGGPANLQTLSELAQLRREYAQLFGFDAYADFVMRRRMAGNAAKVETFLGSVKDAVVDRERVDLALLRGAKAVDVGQPLADTQLQRWDVGHYTERVRRARYEVEANAFRQYFPPEASLKFVFKLAEQLFGVQFSPVTDKLWHPDARAFRVADAASQKLLGTLFVDLYPRADKYNHAAVWPIRSVSTRTGRLPAAALVVNFNRQGLNIDELETLLHEFGHALHGLLSSTRYAMQGGTSVELDFVEAPSQMLEEWVYDPQVLALFKSVCPNCKAVPKDMLARAERARHFAKGIQFARQQLYASYDLRLNGKQPVEPLPLWAEMEGATPLGHVKGSMLPASFGHLASHYAAGYYGYLWSLVLAEDLRTAFAANRLDAAVGQRYRDSVLANGGQVPPQSLLQQFLGRPSNSAAFFESLNK
jgi:thimet oligopeptidase